jgi:hypothetical protein
MTGTKRILEGTVDHHGNGILRAKGTRKRVKEGKYPHFPDRTSSVLYIIAQQFKEFLVRYPITEALNSQRNIVYPNPNSGVRND